MQTKQTDQQAKQLTRQVKSYASLGAEIEEFDRQATEHGVESLRAIIQAGHRLWNAFEDPERNIRWEDWLKQYCPRMSSRKDSNYRRLARAEREVEQWIAEQLNGGEPVSQRAAIAYLAEAREAKDMKGVPSLEEITTLFNQVARIEKQGRYYVAHIPPWAEGYVSGFPRSFKGRKRMWEDWQTFSEEWLTGIALARAALEEAKHRPPHPLPRDRSQLKTSRVSTFALNPSLMGGTRQDIHQTHTPSVSDPSTGQLDSAQRKNEFTGHVYLEGDVSPRQIVQFGKTYSGEALTKNKLKGIFAWGDRQWVAVRGAVLDGRFAGLEAVGVVAVEDYSGPVPLHSYEQQPESIRFTYCGQVAIYQGKQYALTEHRLKLTPIVLNGDGIPLEVGDRVQRPGTDRSPYTIIGFTQDGLVKVDWDGLESVAEPDGLDLIEAVESVPGELGDSHRVASDIPFKKGDRVRMTEGIAHLEQLNKTGTVDGINLQLGLVVVTWDGESEQVPYEPDELEPIDEPAQLVSIEVLTDNTPRSVRTLKSGEGNGQVQASDRYTPEWLWRPALEVFGVEEFDLDPMTDDSGFCSVPARVKYTQQMDGLKQPWKLFKDRPTRMWSNPAFHLNEAFTWRLAAEVADGMLHAIVLDKHDHRSAWCRRLISHAAIYCQIAKSVKFNGIDGEGRPLESSFFPITVFYFGPEPEKFAAAYHQLGVLAKAVEYIPF